MSAQPSASTSSTLLLRAVVYAAAIVLALVHVFVTFRGLKSEAGMEQAQVARELARGHGFQTKVIRPYVWARMNASAKEVTLSAMPEVTQPPLQPLLWAPVFKAVERHQTFEPTQGGSIYLLDRAIACLGVTGLLLTLLWTHGAARRLFDENIATVVLLCLMVCEPLWLLSVSGSPLALLLPLFALTFRLIVSAQIRVQEGQNILVRAILIGLLASLMLLTHWMALWLVVGLVLAATVTLPGRKSTVVVIAALPLVTLVAWGWWNTRLCGDPLGGAKTLFQSFLLTLDPSLLQREFSISTQPVFVDDLLRKLAMNWRAQSSLIFAYLGYLAPALAFFGAILHRFRRQETARSSLLLAIIFASVTLGMGCVGLPNEADDDNALYIVLAPAMTIFGTAMLAVLWARLQGGTLVTFWQRLGFGVLAIGASALPMAADLPPTVKVGLILRGRIHPHWPPYVPDRVTFVRKLIEPTEIVFSDAPWFVAWYADVPTAWLPVKRTDFTTMAELAEAKGHPVAGIVVTPISSRVNHLHEIFAGPYQEWPDLVLRGPMLALDREFLPHPNFKYKLPLPIVGVSVGSKENLSMQMTFYTDRARSLKK